MHVLDNLARDRWLPLRHRHLLVKVPSGVTVVITWRADDRPMPCFRDAVVNRICTRPIMTDKISLAVFPADLSGNKEKKVALSVITGLMGQRGRGTSRNQQSSGHEERE